MSQRKSSTMYPLVKQYLESNKSAQEFCDNHALKIYVLNYWLQKYRKEPPSNIREAFQEVDIKDRQVQGIIIRYPSGVEIEIPFPC